MDENINENDNDGKNFQFNKPNFKLVDHKITILFAPKVFNWSK